MDAEEEVWLAELIQDTLNNIASRPGLTIEVDEQPSQWVQIIPQATSGSEEAHAGLLVNFPFRVQPEGEPLSTEPLAGIPLPPGTELIESEPGSHATLWIPPDIPLALLVHLCVDILVNIVGASAQASINAHFEYGL